MFKHNASFNLLPTLRKTTQFLMLAFLGQWAFYGIFRCPFLVPFVSCQVCPVLTCWGRITSYFWSFWLFLPLSALFFGRVFCGWFCPGGLLNQLLGKLAPFKLRIRNRILSWTPLTMLLTLSLTLFLWLWLDNPRSMVPIRIGEFWSSIRLSFEHASLNWLIRTYLLLALVLAGLIVSNLWCRFFCPTGGLLEVLKRFSLFSISKTSACNDCDLCRQKCEMGTRPAETNCTNCGDCLSCCPSNAIKLARKRSQNE